MDDASHIGIPKLDSALIAKRIRHVLLMAKNNPVSGRRQDREFPIEGER